MATTTWVRTDGFLVSEEGHQVPGSAELTLRGLIIRDAGGRELAVWRSGDLVQSADHDAIRLYRRKQAGAFSVPVEGNTEFILALAAIPDADAPMLPGAVLWTMAGMIGVSLVGLVLVAWLLFLLAEWWLGAGLAL